MLMYTVEGQYKLPYNTVNNTIQYSKQYHIQQYKLPYNIVSNTT